ncbi:MAG: T9SS C-terminal target domain-containing protein [Ignavibacteriae bacterium]|nr:MAG: T9SS C-terminal target domain-containing protein [Ignavibacteriota bacterium]
MKYSIIILFFLLVFNNYAQPVKVNENYYSAKDEFTNDIFNWQYIQLPYPFNITDIFFKDSLYGWASHEGNGVFRTTDSGFNWDTSKFGTNNHIGGVHFIDRYTGWTVGVGGKIRKTINGGINWKIQDYEPYAGYYNKVHFFNSDTGVVIGSKNGPYGYIIKTTNSGNNWSEIFISNQIYTELKDQYWLNSDSGWLCGSNILLKTTNGGTNFINYYTNIPPTQNGSNALLGIDFVNENTGWICGSNLEHRNIYKTTNAGLNWYFQNNPVASYEYAQVNDIKFINSDSGWAGSFVGIILFTSNGGSNWLIDLSANDEFWSLCNYKNSKIWSGGAHGKIWYTLINPPIGVISNKNQIPLEYHLFQNYPNPFNPSTTIKYDISNYAQVTFKIYDILGKEIYSSNEFKKAGRYEFEFNGSNFASGLYFYKLETGEFKQVKKMVLIK